MAIPPLQPHFSLPPRVAKSAPEVAQAHFVLPGETGPSGLSLEDATKQFGESIQALSPEDRKEIQIIHSAVDEWTVGKPNPDKLGQFLVRVMMYADQRLDALQANPGAASDSQNLERVFRKGFQMVEVYAGVGQR